jgi:hypothetical protein
MSTVDLTLTKVKDVPFSLRFDIEKILNDHWESVLSNLPSVRNNKITFDDETRRHCSDKKNNERPGDIAMNFLLKKAIRLNELFESFTITDNEDGLYLLNKPETDMKIIRPPVKVTNVNSRDPIEIVCEVECFPKPTFSFHRKGIDKVLQTTNKFILKSAT